MDPRQTHPLPVRQRGGEFRPQIRSIRLPLSTRTNGVPRESHSHLRHEPLRKRCAEMVSLRTLHGVKESRGGKEKAGDRLREPYYGRRYDEVWRAVRRKDETQLDRDPRMYDRLAWKSSPTRRGESDGEASIRPMGDRQWETHGKNPGRRGKELVKTYLQIHPTSETVCLLQKI